MKTLLVLAVLCLGPAVARAEAPPATPEAITREIVELHGFQRRLQGLAENIRLTSKSSTDEDRNRQARFLIAFRRAFEPGAMYQSVAGHFQRSYDPALSPSALEWLRTPLAKKLGELDAAETANTGDLGQFFHELQARPPSKARIALVGRLETARGDVPLQRLLAESVSRASIDGANALEPKAKRRTQQALDRMLAEQLEKSDEPMKRVTRIKMLRAMQPLADEELEDLVMFFESDAGRWLVETRMGAYAEALADARTKLLELLAQTLADKR